MARCFLRGVVSFFLLFLLPTTWTLRKLKMLILASAVAVLMLFLCSSSAMRAEPQRRHSEGIAEDARILFLCTAKLLLFLHVCNSCPLTCEANVRQVVNLTVLADYSCLRCTMPHKYDQKFKYINNVSSANSYMANSKLFLTDNNFSQGSTS